MARKLAQALHPLIGSRAVRRAWVAALLLAALACTPADPLARIREQQEAGNFADTVEPLRELLEQRPDEPEANFLYGVALLYTGQPSLAPFPLRQAMKDSAWLLPAGMQLAQAGLLSGDFNEAVHATSLILEQNPDEAQALLLRAQAHAHWKQDPQAALDDANRVMELQPEMIEAYEPKILALLALGRHEEATAALAEAGTRLPEGDTAEGMRAWHCSTTGIFAAEAGKLDEARKIFAGCLEKFPLDPTVVANAVEFYDAHREMERSIEVLRAAMEKAPNPRSFRTGLADRLRVTGKAAEGEALLREATSADDPREALAAWADLARYRQMLREHAAAADALERAVALTEKFGKPDPALLFQYADALVASGQLDRAEKIAADLEVPAQKKLIVGRVAQERGQTSRALAEFDEALRLWPNNAVAHYYTALAAERLGDFDRALEEYRYAIRIDVGGSDARTRAAELLIAEGKPLLAYQLLFLEVAKVPLDPAGELLSMYLMARVANPSQLQSSLVTLMQRDPARYPLALARGAEGAADRAGARAALALLRGAPGVNYSDPRGVASLRVYVRLAHAAGEGAAARRTIDAALKAHPGAADFHQVLGLHLELSGDGDAALAAYERALELDPANAEALAGTGRVLLARAPGEALAFFDRALAADPMSDAEVALGAARALRASGRLDEASRRLDALLVRKPYESEAASEQVSLDLERGAVTRKTLERAQRAARFGGGVDALEQLGEVHAALGETEEATKALERAKHLREQRAKGTPEPGEGGTHSDGGGSPAEESPAGG